MNKNRQLAAIMFTDIQGYTALMQQDENLAYEMRKRHREIFNATTNKYKGKILQYYGDGTLSIFNSVVDSVNCAAEMQVLFQKAPLVPVRIGIHLGDIIVADDEVIGDAVNIASRIESLAVVGSVLVSERVQMELSNHDDILTQSLGQFLLKNVKKPIEIFALATKGLVIPGSSEMQNKGWINKEIPNNLAIPVTRFFGRKKELKQVQDLLAGHRLVTLLGAGGCGKTRLASEVARLSMDSYPDGVWFVALAPLTSTELVVDTLAETLLIKPEKSKPIEDTIASRISDKKMLIIVDNCEHLIGECARMLALIISHTEKPLFLATSREALNISGEASYRTPPLAVPEIPSELSEIVSFDSVQLFRDRAMMHKPDFELNDDNIEAVCSICQKLDGIPLAIEMAASRIAMMTAETISDRLSDQFRLLSGGIRTALPHQQTLRATIDWSNNLLTEDEKVLFHRLSVFTGDFDLEDAEKVCGYGPLSEFQVMDLLARLVDKSLVTTLEREKMVRYSLLEVMKQYGLEKVTQNGKLELVRKRFANFYIDQAGTAYKERMKNNIKWTSWFSLELSNLLGALNIFQGDPGQRLKLAGLLVESFFLHANLSIGHKILSTALEASAGRNVDRARVLCGLGFLEVLIDPDKGYQRMKEGIEIIQELDDKQAKVDVYFKYGALQSFYKEWDNANKILEEGLQIARDIKDPWLEVSYKNQMHWIAITQLEPDQVEADAKLNLAEAERLEYNTAITDARHLLADISFLKGEYLLAEKRYLEAASNAQKLGSGLELGVLLHSIALSVAAQGRHEKGLRLFGASKAKLEELGAELPAVDSVTTRIKQTIGKSIELLGDEKSQSLDLEGRQMGLERAVEYALDTDKD